MHLSLEFRMLTLIVRDSVSIPYEIAGLPEYDFCADFHDRKYAMSKLEELKDSDCHTPYRSFIMKYIACDMGDVSDERLSDANKRRSMLDDVRQKWIKISSESGSDIHSLDEFIYSVVSR